MNKKIFRVTLNVVDVKTQINLGNERILVTCNRPASAGRRAAIAYKTQCLNVWKSNTCEDYELTATQLEWLIKDGLITPPDIVDVRVVKVEEFANVEEFAERG